MSINPARETKRLNDTITKITKVEETLGKAKKALDEINKATNTLLDKRTELSKKIDAMVHAKSLAQAHIDAWKGQEIDLGYPKDELEMDAEQIKAADESLAKYYADLATIDGALGDEGKNSFEARKKAEEELNKVDNELGVLLVTKAQQEEALKKVEAAYPTLLKRHLRKCKKYGWTDARLAGGKKK